MDPISAAVACGQGAVYVTETIRFLIQLCHCIKNRGSILQDHLSSIINLKSIIIRIRQSKAVVITAELAKLLNSIALSAEGLIYRLDTSRSLRAAVTIVVKQNSIKEKFTALERQKSTLILYLTAENAMAPTKNTSRQVNDPPVTGTNTGFPLKVKHRSRI